MSAVVRPSRDRRAVLDGPAELIGGLKPHGFGAAIVAQCVRDARTAAEVLFIEQPEAEKAYADQRIVFAIAKALGVEIDFVRPVPAVWGAVQ